MHPAVCSGEECGLISRTVTGNQALSILLGCLLQRGVCNIYKQELTRLDQALYMVFNTYFVTIEISRNAVK